MEKQDVELGAVVRFRRPLHRVYVSGGHEQGYPLLPRTAPRKEWRPDEDRSEWRGGIVVGVRTLADGKYDHGGYDEQAFLYDKTYQDAVLVAFALRSKPVYVLLEDVEPVVVDIVEPVKPPAEGRVW